MNILESCMSASVRDCFQIGLVQCTPGAALMRHWPPMALSFSEKVDFMEIGWRRAAGGGRELTANRFKQFPRPPRAALSRYKSVPSVPVITLFNSLRLKTDRFM
ncbi:hypothetical protein EVAR_23579_1 [Eumeta japonica]|uniref:Uncharacterized protein n=1 Tax=Eumeta variegata TaxID=151549 RepID=A0A4C1WZ71_EUMVA|nr:hypothetical protein EVAR_23579_1 [Eumeta japonica]